MPYGAFINDQELVQDLLHAQERTPCFVILVWYAPCLKNEDGTYTIQMIL